MEFAKRETAAPSLPLWTSEGSVQMPMDTVAMDDVKTTPFERRFNPYDFNGGTVVAIAGADFAVVAGDTRISTGYEILSRNQSKIHPLTDTTSLVCAGCLSDIIQLKKTLQARLTQYQHSQGTIMPGSAIAQLLSVTLYGRRFFPFYAFCMVAGVDDEGVGAVYGYDAVGSFKRDKYGCMGSGQNFIWPLLDNLIGHKNRLDEEKPLSAEEVVSIMKELFIVAAERDIHTGDSVEIRVIRKDRSTVEVFPLKKD
eukprot:gene28531-34441_t